MGPETPCDVLHAHARAGSWEAIVTAVSEGAPLDVRDPHAATLLHAAASNGHEEIVLLLLRSGLLDVHAQTVGGATALQYAASAGHVGVVQMLLSAEMRLGVPAPPGAAAANAAAVQALFSRLALQIDMCADPVKTALLGIAVLARNCAWVDFLVTHHARVDLGVEGSTVLHLAVFLADLPILKRLLQAHKNIQPLDVYCVTPLQLAITYRRFACIMVLLEAGALSGSDAALDLVVWHSRLELEQAVARWLFDAALDPPESAQVLEIWNWLQNQRLRETAMGDPGAAGAACAWIPDPPCVRWVSQVDTVRLADIAPEHTADCPHVRTLASCSESTAGGTRLSAFLAELKDFGEQQNFKRFPAYAALCFEGESVCKHPGRVESYLARSRFDTRVYSGGGKSSGLYLLRCYFEMLHEHVLGFSSARKRTISSARYISDIAEHLMQRLGIQPIEHATVGLEHWHAAWVQIRQHLDRAPHNREFHARDLCAPPSLRAYRKNV